MLKLIFENTIKASLLSSVLIVVMLFLRKRCFKKYNSRFNYYIWIVILFKMIIPFRVPIYVKQEGIKASTAIRTIENLNIYKNITVSQENIDIVSILSIIWLIVFIIMISYNLIKIVIINNSIERVSSNIYDKNTIEIFKSVKDDMGITKIIKLKKSSKIAIPFIIRIINPCIIIPDAPYSKNQLKWVLRHELTHYKRKDNLYKFLVIIAKSIHFFNPLIYKLQGIIDEECEISCDDMVLTSYDFESKKEYATVLIDSMKFNNKFCIQNKFTSTLNKDNSLIR